MGRFAKQTSDLFANEDILRDGYTPNEMIARDEEMRDYENSLNTAVKGNKPNNIFVYGETGLGKTLASNVMIDELKEDESAFDNVSFEFIWVNCKNKTSYSVATAIVNDLRDDDEQISKIGYSNDYVTNLMWEEFQELDTTHVYVILDEVDSLGTDDDLLYSLSRANSEGFIDEEDLKVGIIGISNDFKFRDNLSSRVKEKLCEDEILFDHYNADQLGKILEQRAEKAFVDEGDVLDAGVIPYIAADVAHDSGSARHALDVLRKAGKIARKEDAEQITEDHARLAYEKIESGLIEDDLRSLPTQSHIILYALIIMAENNRLPAKKAKIYELYKELAEEHDVRIKSQRTIHDRLSEMALGSILNKTEKATPNGRFHVYGFDTDPDLVREVLVDNERMNVEELV